MDKIDTNPVVSLMGIIFLFSARSPKNSVQKTELHVASKYLSMSHFVFHFGRSWKYQHTFHLNYFATCEQVSALWLSLPQRCWMPHQKATVDQLWSSWGENDIRAFFRTDSCYLVQGILFRLMLGSWSGNSDGPRRAHYEFCKYLWCNRERYIVSSLSQFGVTDYSGNVNYCEQGPKSL